MNQRVRQSESPRFTAAMLKVAVMMKKTPHADFDQIVEEVASNLQIDKLRFRQYMAEHRQVFAVAQARERH